MPIFDANALEVIERRAGWHGRFFNSPSMTFAQYTFEKGSSIHEHFHEQEEVWQILEGELEITIDGETLVAGPGFVVVVAPNVRHAVRALSDGRAFVVDHPLRDIPGVPSARSS